MKKILLILSALAMIASCSTRYEDVNDELLVDNPQLKISAKAGAMPFYVYYDGEWTVEIIGDCRWAELRETSGKGVTMVWMDYEANRFVSRSLVLLVSGGGMTKEIKVTQSPGLTPNLTFEPASVQLAANGEEVRVKVLTNVNEKNIGNFLRKIEYGEGGEGWLTVGTMERGEEEPVVSRADTTFTYYIGLSATENQMAMTKSAQVTYYAVDAADKEYASVLTVEQTF